MQTALLAIIIAFSIGIASIIAADPLPSDKKPASEGTGSAATYMQFRALTKAAKYEEAFTFLNTAARQEYRSITMSAFIKAGVPSAQYKEISDLECFILCVTKILPAEIKITAENTDHDNATLTGSVIQGGQTLQTTIMMKKERDRWLIQTTGISWKH